MALRFLKFGGLALSVAALACSNTLEGPGDGDTPGVTGGSSGSGGSAKGGNGAGNTGGSSGSSSGSGGTSAGSGGTAGSSSAAAALNLNGSPAFHRMVRLTNEQWTNSVQSILRLQARPTLAEAFQTAVSGTTDFTNNELVLDVDARRWGDYRTAAQALANQVTSDAAQLRNVYQGMDAAGFITTVGLRVYRRPLTSDEVAKYQALYDKGAAMTGDKSAFAKGAAVVLEAMLQSPHFLYRTELGPANAPLSTYEMAAKLSLWLRNTTPDDALLQAAATPGNLDTPEGAALVAQQMLEEAAASTVMRQFHGEFLHFDRFEHMSKVGVPSYNPDIAAELAESSHLFFNRIFTQGLGVDDIFTSTVGFVGPLMSSVYGGAGATPNGMAERDLGATRSGYFLQLPFLMLHAHNAEPDAIHRGVSVSLDVLCSQLGPPADVVPQLPARQPGQTNRQRIDAHTKECGQGCHNAMINPLGFAFENFDGMGQYREVEVYPNEMLPIDASGEFEFVDGIKSWNTGAELMGMLATEPQTHLCYSKKLASFGLQRDVVVADAPLLTDLASVSASTNGSVKDVIVALVKHNAFRTRAGGLP